MKGTGKLNFLEEEEELEAKCEIFYTCPINDSLPYCCHSNWKDCPYYKGLQDGIKLGVKRESNKRGE